MTQTTATMTRGCSYCKGRGMRIYSVVSIYQHLCKGKKRIEIGNCKANRRLRDVKHSQWDKPREIKLSVRGAYSPGFLSTSLMEFGGTALRKRDIRSRVGFIRKVSLPVQFLH